VKPQIKLRPASFDELAIIVNTIAGQDRRFVAELSLDQAD